MRDVIDSQKKVFSTTLDQYRHHSRFFYYFSVSSIIDGITVDEIKYSKYRILISAVLHFILNGKYNEVA